MNAKSVVGFILLCFADYGCLHILEQKTTLTECQNTCSATGGQPLFNEETKTCRCLLSKNIDDIDITVIKKNARLLGQSFNDLESFHPETVIIKRDVSAEITTTLSPQTTTDNLLTDAIPVTDDVVATTNEEKSEIDLNPEGIVGQAPANRRAHQRPISPTRRQRDSRPMTADQQRIILTQIRDHLNRLSQLTDQRTREFEIEAIRGNLRQLSGTNLVQTPQMRARGRNIVEETRKRQQRPRLLHSRLVGATASPVNDNVTEEGSIFKDHFSAKKRHFEIITQDPRLIDE